MVDKNHFKPAWWFVYFICCFIFYIFLYILLIFFVIFFWNVIFPVAGINAADACRKLNELFSDMILIKGFVHCDPHSGNILVSKGEGGVTISLLDHGLYTVNHFINVPAYQKPVISMSKSGRYEEWCIVSHQSNLKLRIHFKYITAIFLLKYPIQFTFFSIISCGHWGLSRDHEWRILFTNFPILQSKDRFHQRGLYGPNT